MEYLKSLHPIDIDCYSWKQHKQDAHVWQRKALARENHWYTQPAEIRGLYLGGTVSLAEEIDSAKFKKVAEAAWLRVRFEHPEVAMTSGVNDDGQVLMSCTIARDEEDAHTWSSKMLSIEPMDGPFSFRESSLQLCRSKVPASPQRLRFYVPQSIEEASISSFGFLFCLDHHFVDGAGAKILADSFLKSLGNELHRAPSTALSSSDWKDSIKNLAPPWIQMMNEDQHVSGPSFDEAVRCDSQILVDARVNGAYGIKITSKENQRYNPESLVHRFSHEESAALVAASKKLGQSYNITQVAHAAMVVAMLQQNPPITQSEDGSGKSLISQCFMNGRRYLEADEPKARTYVPICIATGIVEFSDVDQYTLSALDGEGHSDKHKARDVFLRACGAANRSYQAIRERKSILSESLQRAESVPKYLPRQHEDVADPYLLSDGLWEQFISRDYRAESSFSDADANSASRKVFSVEDLNLYATPEGPAALIVRMSNFRDVMTLSAEWDEAMCVRSTIQRLLEDMVWLMSLLI